MEPMKRVAGYMDNKTVSSVVGRNGDLRDAIFVVVSCAVDADISGVRCAKRRCVADAESIFIMLQHEA